MIAPKYVGKAQCDGCGKGSAESGVSVWSVEHCGHTFVFCGLCLRKHMAKERTR